MKQYSLQKENGVFVLYYDTHRVTHFDPLTGAMKNLVLTVGEEPAVHIQQIFFTMNSNDVFPCKWDAASYSFALTQKEDEAVIDCFACNADRTMKSTAQLRFSLPDEHRNIRIAVTQKLEILQNTVHRGFGGIDDDGNAYGYLEVTDPYPYHAVGPAIDFQGYWKGLYLYGQECDSSVWRKKYQYLMYTKDGSATGYYLNHFGSPLGRISLDDHSILGLYDRNCGALLYHFPYGQRQDLKFSLCTWGYDLHFYIPYPQVQAVDERWSDFFFQKGQSFSTEYEIEYLTPDQAADVIRRASFPEYTEAERKMFDKPVICGGINRFQKQAAPDDLFSFPFELQNGIWRHDVGYDDCSSLELDGRNQAAEVGYNIGADHFSETIRENQLYQISFMARACTPEVRLTISMKFYVPIYPGYHSLPKEGNAYETTVILHPDEDFQLCKLEAMSPAMYSTICKMNIQVTDGRLILDNLYFGKA